jgi:hypothetical protein
MAKDDGEGKRGWGIDLRTAALWTVASALGMWLNDTIRLLLGR